MLSPNDEWAGFEIFPFRIATTIPSDVPGSYLREALLHGLEMEERGGFNPFRFGVIGASDSHVAAGPFEESNYWGVTGSLDGAPLERGSVPVAAGVVSTTPSARLPSAPRTAQPREGGEQPPPNPTPMGQYADTSRNLYGASGLTGVWAEENTRESIYDALRRKETFATSGPRMQVRFFGGFALSDGLAEDLDSVAKAYAAGVPMGGDLVGPGGVGGAKASGASGAGTAASSAAPRFLVWAMRDARSAPLQRLQVVKGWVEDGEGRERIYDVACTDGLVPDLATHRCPDNGATVDLATCAATEGVGAAELRTLWTDPDFDPSLRAFYYLRVLENPTCRWSTWDALRAGVPPNPKLPPTIQERAWSSPIWYAPGAGNGASGGR